MLNRRVHARSHLLKRGLVVLGNGYSTVECVVLDVSSGGALLKFSGFIGLPKTFELRLDSGVRHRVEVCHTTFDTAGVRFVHSA